MRRSLNAVAAIATAAGDRPTMTLMAAAYSTSLQTSGIGGAQQLQQSRAASEDKRKTAKPFSQKPNCVAERFKR
jgi:hypothetical protein